MTASASGNPFDGPGLRERPEDLASVVLLATAIAVALAGIAYLLDTAVGGGDAAAITGVALYGCALVAGLGGAMTFHAGRTTRHGRTLQAVDHCTIFVLIAGTYTPFCLIALAGHGGTTLLVLVWTIAATGIGNRVYRHGRVTRGMPALYLIQGWIGLPWIGALLETLSTATLILLLVGGLLYSGGVAFYRWTGLPFANVVWHAFVVAGTACHYAAVLLMVRGGA